MNKKNIVGLIGLLLLVGCIYYFNLTREGMSNTADTCASRTTAGCGKCLANHDSTGSICYWCKDWGCVNPDDYDNDIDTFNQKCSSDKSCNNPQPGPQPQPGPEPVPEQYPDHSPILSCRK